MTGEESHIETEVILASNVCDRGEVIQCLFRNGIRLWLKVVPQQKETDNFQPNLMDHTKFFTNFTRIEVVPPIHGFTTGPIVHTEDKIVSRGKVKHLNLHSIGILEDSDQSLTTRITDRNELLHRWH